MQQQAAPHPLAAQPRSAEHAPTLATGAPVGVHMLTHQLRPPPPFNQPRAQPAPILARGGLPVTQPSPLFPWFAEHCHPLPRPPCRPQPRSICHTPKPHSALRHEPTAAHLSSGPWLFWPSRSGAGGVTRQPPLCAPSREPRRQRCRFVSGPAWSLCLLPAGPHSCPTQPCRPLLPLSPNGRGHSSMPTVRSRPWVSFVQMQVRRPSPLAGCLPASCTSHSRWPYKWLVCLPCPAAPLKQGFRGDETRRWRKGARKRKKHHPKRQGNAPRSGCRATNA